MNADNVARREVLFVHGGGDRGYEADAPLAASLRQHLGANYNLRYPRMPENDALPDFGWGQAIGNEMATVSGGIFLVGHSLGASMLLKYLSDHALHARVRGLFLLATPFWSGEEDWQQGLKLRDNFEGALPRDVPTFLYHNQDDEEVDGSHLAIYKTKLPWANVRVGTGGHQFNNNLALVARDIQGLG
jgi:predicted alpha/beta hydrolase family esterase